MSGKSREFLGFTDAEKIKFEHFLQMLHAEDREQFRQALMRALDGGGDYESEYRIVLPDGVMRCDFAHNAITVDVHLPDSLPAVIGDKIQIQQVLLNLLHNGCDAMAYAETVDKQLRIGAQQSGDEVEITVADRGLGIPCENIEKIFEPFFTDKTQGMGLGLPICRNIVTAHGGRLWVNNNGNGRGAKFHFTLPIRPAKNA